MSSWIKPFGLSLCRSQISRLITSLLTSLMHVPFGMGMYLKHVAVFSILFRYQLVNCRKASSAKQFAVRFRL